MLIIGGYFICFAATIGVQPEEDREAGLYFCSKDWEAQRCCLAGGDDDGSDLW